METNTGHQSSESQETRYLLRPVEIRHSEAILELQYLNMTSEEDGASPGATRNGAGLSTATLLQRVSAVGIGHKFRARVNRYGRIEGMPMPSALD